MPIEISDPADPRLDDYRSLGDQRFRRRYEGDELFVAEGFVSVERLLESDHAVRSVLLGGSRAARFERHLPALDALGVPVHVASREVIAAVVGFDAHRGVLAIGVRRPAPGLDELVARSRRLAWLEGLNDPENLGAIARAARAFGVDGLLVDATCTDPYSRRTVRVSMGEVLTLPVVRVPTFDDALPALTAYETWAMTPAGDADDLWVLKPPERVVVMLGAEGPGLSAAAIGAASRRVRIPIARNVDSLNVGHAAAVTFAALSRHDRPPGHLGSSSPS